MASSSNVECEDELNEAQADDYKELIYKLFQYKTYKLRDSNGELRCPFCGYGEEENDCNHTHLLLHAIRLADKGSESRKERASHFAMARYMAVDLANDVKAEAQQLSWSEDSHTVRKRPRLDGDSTKVGMVAADKGRHDLERQLNEAHDQLNDLIKKERLSNDELQEARRELIKGLGDILRGNHVQIGIKNIGELDSKVFISEMEKRFFSIYAVIKGVELCSLWQEKLKNPQWYPFQIIEDDEGNPQRVLKDDDLSLQDLKKEWGHEIHNAVVKALGELHEYNPSGCYVIPELWNFEEDRKAKLDELIGHIIEAVKDVFNNMGNTSDINNSRIKGLKERGDLSKTGSTSYINDSDEESAKERVYELLKSCTYEVRGNNGQLRCPFCVSEEELEYDFLFQHALTVVAEGSSGSAEQRANHFALAKYLVIDLPYVNIEDVFQMESTLDIINSRIKEPTIRRYLSSCINDSDEESDKKRIYELLKSCTYKVRGNNGQLRCPFCFVEQVHNYNYLIRHAFTVAESSSECSKQRANHFVLAKYLTFDLPAEFENIEDLQHEKCRREYVLKERELKRLSEVHEDLKSSNGELFAKERQKNDELNRAREELIKGLIECQSGNSFSIGMKKMGEIDVNTFKRVCRKRFPQKEAEIRAIAECSMWQQKLKNLNWNPFLLVRDDKGSFQSLLNDDDESLQGLKHEWGR